MLGLTIHKSQGMSLESAVVDLGVKEMALGSSLVALSRLKTPDGLVLSPVPYDRMLAINRKGELPALKTELARLPPAIASHYGAVATRARGGVGAWHSVLHKILLTKCTQSE